MRLNEIIWRPFALNKFPSEFRITKHHACYARHRDRNECLATPTLGLPSRLRTHLDCVSSNSVGIITTRSEFGCLIRHIVNLFHFIFGARHSSTFALAYPAIYRNLKLAIEPFRCYSRPSVSNFKLTMISKLICLTTRLIK